MVFAVYMQLQQIYLPALHTSDLVHVPVCCFNTNKKARGFKGRRRAATTHQCGNSMAVQSIGAILLFVFAFTDDVTDSNVPMSLCDIAPPIQSGFLQKLSRGMTRARSDYRLSFLQQPHRQLSVSETDTPASAVSAVSGQCSDSRSLRHFSVECLEDTQESQDHSSVRSGGSAAGSSFLDRPQNLEARAKRRRVMIGGALIYNNMRYRCVVVSRRFL